MATETLISADARQFAANLEDEMGMLNPSGLALLHTHLGPDLNALSEACVSALTANDGHQIVLDPHAGDNGMVAMMKDIVERLASCTGQNVVWTGGSGSQAKTLMARTKSEGTFGRKNSRGRGMSIKLKNLVSSSVADSIPVVTNKESALFVCCSRLDAVSHARVLRAELSVRKPRGCAVGGGYDSSKFIKGSEAVV
eukprot:1408444-Prymnesium_polylepis.1